jgi:Protein of unknown function (DUF1552)
MKPTIQSTGRRNFLRGALWGVPLTLGLPYLDCFLNENGSALASGLPLPSRFGTWFQGNGLEPGWWEPTAVGAYDMRELLAPLQPYRDRINIYSGFRAFLDEHPAVVHVSGRQVINAGGVTSDDSLPTIDTLIADKIGARSRFRSIEVACNGAPTTYSSRSASSINASEFSPAALYLRLFGSDFVNPNAADFKPDPALLARRSILSGFAEQRRSLVRDLGTADRARLDEYFSSVRQLEQQISLSLEKPAPMEACTVAAAPAETTHGKLIDQVNQDHKLFATLLAHALACGQTNVFNVVWTENASQLRAPASAMTFHLYTHEEEVDPKLHYQRNVMWFFQEAMKAYGSFVNTLASYREGDGNLLDRTTVMYFTDHGHARFHTLTNIPVITAGSGGGRLKTGVHVAGNGDSISRVGLTLQQAFGVSAREWGTESNETSKGITEVMV